MPDPQNPYAPSFGIPEVLQHGTLPDAVQKKVEAIIKDAGQVFLAILLMFICSGCGFVLIGPWYAVRLMQWNSIATQFPELCVLHPPVGSLAEKFQKARTKLWIGVIVGIIIFCGAGMLVVFLSVTGPVPAPMVPSER